uniref:helix-turn-helix domain-containing protein n=1 Tax=Streptomyces himalayensis TaxID=2820085 RepID=UPI0028A8820A|nr:helix-turn-helix transcriptional regulator [Streptomyces himalayensis]
MGLPTSGHRRVPGLRREELASLAGVSVDYIMRLEQGRVKSASPAILTALARALELRPDEEEYLLRCAAESGASSGATSATPRNQQMSQATQALLGNMVNVPALVLGRRMDILAWNSLSAALFTEYSKLPAKRRNHIWLTFLDPEVRRLYTDWETVAECLMCGAPRTRACSSTPRNLTLRAHRPSISWPAGLPPSPRPCRRRQQDHPGAEQCLRRGNPGTGRSASAGRPGAPAHMPTRWASPPAERPRHRSSAFRLNPDLDIV